MFPAGAAPIDNPVLPNETNPHQNMNYYTPGPSGYKTRLPAQKMYPDYVVCSWQNDAMNQQIQDRMVPKDRYEMTTDMRPGFHVCQTYIEPARERVIAHPNHPMVGKGNMSTFVENVNRDRILLQGRRALCNTSSDVAVVHGAGNHLFSKDALPCATPQCTSVDQPQANIKKGEGPQSCAERFGRMTDDMFRLPFNHSTRATTQKMTYRYR